MQKAKFLFTFPTIFFVYISFFISSIYSQERIIPVVVDGDEVSYSQENKIVIAKGNVKITYTDITLYCERAKYNAETNIAEVEGNVRIESNKGIIYGEHITYDFNKKEAVVDKVKITATPYYGSAKGTSYIKQNKYVLKGAYITTCDLDNPHYRITAKRIVIYPKDKIVAKNIVLKIGAVPVFYFPYFSQSLEDTSFPFELYPGKDKDWGTYILTRYRYYNNKENKGKIYFDWYENRGWGEGINHKFTTDKWGEGLIKLYYIDDALYDKDKRDALFERYPERSNISDKYLDNNRYKIQFFHSWKPRPGLSITSEFHKFSDEYFIKDFFYREYEREPHQFSYNLIDYSLGNASLSLLTQKRTNRFFTETEYLPQLEYNFYRQPIFNSDLNFESKTSLSNLTKKFANSATDYDAIRFFSHNVVNIPKSIGFLNIDPYVGSYTVFYSKNTFGEENIWREAFETGITLTTKLYKVFGRETNFFGEKVKKFRHIITPQIEYKYIHEPTVSNDHIFQFDSLDDLSRMEKLIITLYNKFQVKTEKEVRDFLYFSPSLEYRINEENKGSYFYNLKTDLEFYPNDKFSLTGDVEYDFLDRAFKEASIDFTFRDPSNEKYELSFGHRYTRNNSSQSTLSLRYKINPKLEFMNYLRYEYKGGRFEKQFILRRDLHCWWMDIGLDISEEKDYTIWFVFKLKAFPDINVGFETTYSGARSNY